MTIRKGEPWGEPGKLAAGSEIAANDRSLSRILEAKLLSDRPGTIGEIGDSRDQPVEVGLLGGDLHRSVGAPRHTPAELFDGAGVRLPIDVGIVEFTDGNVVRAFLFVAHLVASRGRGSLWASRTVVAMNGSFLGELNLGPRAHPNDGRLDIVDGLLRFGDRRKARSRMLTGTHVPHPALTELRVKNLVVSDDKSLKVKVDGESVGAGAELTIRCIPDAAVIVV